MWRLWERDQDAESVAHLLAIFGCFFFALNFYGVFAGPLPWELGLFVAICLVYDPVVLLSEIVTRIRYARVLPPDSASAYEN